MRRGTSGAVPRGDAVRTRARAMGAGLVCLSLVAAACGGDDNGGSATQATVDEGVKAGVEQQLGGGTSTTEPAAPVERPTTMEDWEALWAEERAAVVERIQSEGLGLSADGTTLTGPEGFTIDLSACPAGWSNTEGLTDTEIKIGHTTALSGTLADYGNIAKAMELTYAYYNAEGVFTDSAGKTRSVNLIVKDDGYDAARTIPLVDELIDSEKVFAMWTLGSPNTLKTYDKLNGRCIPQPFSMTGHPAWGDPVNHPWTTGLQLAYNTEAVLWGAFIEQRLQEFGGQVKVASLIMNNDFGKAYDSGFKAFLAQSPEAANIEYVTETIEPQAPTLKDPMTTLAAQQPDFFIAMIAGAPCVQAITEAAENGMKEDVEYLFMPSVCKSASFVGKDKVGGDGSAADGWWIIGGGAVDFNADATSDDAFVAWGRGLLSDAGIDYHTSGSFGSGFIFSFAMVQALQIAGELEGGLTRTNLVLAIRSMDLTHPLLLEGIKFNMNGNADPYFVEGSDIAKYDSAQQVWVQEGDIIELSGKSTPCAFDQASGTCA
ncbi:MAG: ABC transporter substrate-binding protein [Acidimicrobiia bacterium]|nr:ABC transporter substrate-binding protein [Acidimicrobiia bacterium]